MYTGVAQSTSSDSMDEELRCGRFPVYNRSTGEFIVQQGDRNTERFS